jgi:hypothetical protein
VLYQRQFLVPPSFATWLKNRVQKDFNLGITFSNVEVFAQKGDVFVADLTLEKEPGKPFFKGKNVHLNLGRGARVWAMLRGEQSVELLDATGLELDLTVPHPFLEPAKTTASASPPLIKMTRLKDVRCTVFPGISLNFASVNFEATSPEKKGAFSFHLTENPLGGTILASGSVTLLERPSRIQIQWKDLDLKRLQGLFWLKLLYGIPDMTGMVNFDLTWDGMPATITQAPLFYAQKHLAHDLQGTISWQNLQFAYKGLPLNSNGTLTRIGAEPVRVEIDLNVASGSIQASGSWTPTELLPGSFSASLQANNLYIASDTLGLFALPNGPYESGVYNGQGHVWSTDGALQSRGTLRVREGQCTGFEVPDTVLDWQQTKQTAQASMTMELSPRGSVNVLLEAPLPGFETIVATATFCRFPLEATGRYIPGPVTGNASGTISAVIFPRNIFASEYRGTLELEQAALPNLAIESGRVKIHGKGPEIVFDHPTVVFPDGGTIELRGTVSAKKVTGDIVLKRVAFERLGVKPQHVRGELNFVGTLAGNPRNPLMKGNAWAEKLTLLGHDFAPVKARLIIDKGRLQLDPVVGTPVSGGAVDGNFSLDLLTGDILGMRFAGENLDLAILQAVDPELWQRLTPDGKIFGWVEKRRLPGGSGWGFQLQSPKLGLLKETFHEAHFAGDFAGETLEIRKIGARVWGGTIEGQGRYSRTLGFGGGFTGKDLVPAQSAFMKTLPHKLEGNFAIDGEVEWTPHLKTGYMTLFGKNLRAHDQEIGNLGAEVQFDEKELKIIHADLDKIRLKLTGSIQHAAGWPVQSRMEFDDTDISFIPVLFGLSMFHKGDLTAKGFFEVEGKLASRTIEKGLCYFEKMEVRKGKDVVLANKPVQIRFQNNSFEIRSLELRLHQGLFGVEGLWDPRGPVALTLTGKDFSIAALQNLLDWQRIPLDGTVSIDGGLTGAYPDTRLKADVNIANLAYQGRVIPRIEANCQIDRHGAKVQPLVISLPRNRITLNGTLPFLEAGGMGDLDVVVAIASGPLEDFPTYLPTFFHQARGTIDGKLRLFGNPLAPAIAGNVRVSAEEMSFKGMKRPLKKVELGLKTLDGTIFIDPLRAYFGKGLLQGTGTICFRDGIGSLTAEVVGDNLDLSWSNVDLRRAKARLSAGGNLYNPIIQGSIRIPQGKVQLSDNLLKSMDFKVPLPLQSLQYTFDIDIPRNFWFKNSMLNAEMRGQTKLTGDLKNFHLSGGFQTLQGWLFFQRRKFVIDTGEVRFGEHDGHFDPHIFFKSVTNMQNTQIYLTLEGRLGSFTPKLYSSPPMAEGDLFALLTVGRSMDQALSGNTKDLLEKEILQGLQNTYLSGLLSSTLSNALSLDELFLGSLFDRTLGRSRSFLRMGKYMGNNIFIAYEGTLSNEDRKNFIIEYRLPRGFLLNLEMEQPTNKTQFGVKYDWKF